MNINSFIDSCIENGISFALDGDQLKVNAIPGALSTELVQDIQNNKTKIVSWLKEMQSSRIVPRPNDLKHTPLSYAQQRLWLLDQIDGGSAHYNIPSALRLNGDLDIKVLEQALVHVIKRHEILRTHYRAGDEGEVKLVLQEHFEFEFALEDLSSFDSTVQQSRVVESLRSDAAQCFDLKTDLMLRGRVLKLSERAHVLLLTVHHIAADGWSMGVLVNEVCSCYAALVADKELELPPLEIQYADFAYWQRTNLSSEKLDQDIQYWSEQLKGIPELHALALDKKRPEIQSYKGARFKSVIPKALSVSLKEQCHAQGVTQFMALHAAFSILLSRLSNEKDIVIGSPIAGRDDEALASLIGCFVNTLTLRLRFDDGPSYNECLEMARNVFADAYDHQAAPFEMIVEKLKPARSLSYTPLFQIAFAYQNNDLGALSAPQLTFEAIDDSDHLLAKYDLQLNVMESSEGLNLSWEYNTDLFLETTIENYALCFNQLLRNLLFNPEANVFALPMLDSSLSTFSAPNQDKCKKFTLPLHRQFETQIEQNPDQIALCYQSQQLTYAELNRRANQLARALISKGLKGNQYVGLYMDRSLDLIVAIIAILKTGSAYVPLDPSTPEERVQFILNDSQVSLVLGSDESLKNIRHIELQQPIEFISTDSNLDDYAENNLIPTEVNESLDNIAYIIYTSGSTGLPKGVMVEHKNVVSLFEASDTKFEFNAQDVWTLFHSYAFDFSVWEIWGALLYGARLVIVPHETTRSPQDFHALVNSEQVTVLNQTPSAFGQFIQVDQATEQVAKSNSLRYVIFGGEALNYGSLMPWIDSHGFESPQLVNMYGITETTVHVSFKKLSQEDFRGNTEASSIGLPLPHLDIVLLSPEMQLCPKGVVGEMYVRGEGLARGYLNRPELNRERFIDNPQCEGSERLYKTGDLALRDTEDNLIYKGRSDHQVKIRGFRIELGEIQSVLQAHQQLKDAVVLANGEPKQLLAFVIADSVNAVEENELKVYLRRKLPEYMVPSQIHCVSEFPLTSNGKINQQALLENRPDVLQQESYVAPETELEKKVCKLWAEVLDQKLVGVESSFFDLGGHSLSVLKLVSRMNAELSANVLVRDVFVHKTIRGLINNADFSQSSKLQITLENGLNNIEILKQSIMDDEQQAKHLPKNLDDFFPLSPIQESMVYFSVASPNVPIYHDQFHGMFLWKEFDESCLIEALETLMRQHAILRTSFDIQNYSVPMQLVHQRITTDYLCEDIAGLTEAEQATHIQNYCQSDLQNKFSFEQGEPLWRLRLFNLGKDNFVSILSVQHAIMDGWSVDLFNTALIRSYEAIKAGKPVNQTAGSNSYKDYVAISRERRIADDSKAYWLDHLDGYNRMKLPFNYTGRKLSTSDAMIVKQAWVGEELLAKVADYAKLEGYTFKELCLASYLYMLSAITGEEELLAGVVTHDRPEIDGVENIIGCFLNTVPYRCNVGSVVRKTELLKKVSSYLSTVKEHELFLGDIAKIVGENASAGNPLFDCIFNFTDFDNDLVENGSELSLSESQAKIDLAPAEMTNTLFDFEVHKNGRHGLKLQLKYSERYFLKLEAEKSLDIFVRILELFVSDSEVLSLDKTSLQSISETDIRFNDTRRDYPINKLLHSDFEYQAQQSPDAIALTKDGIHYSYRELNARANRIAHYLLEKNVKVGDKVGIDMYRGFDLIAGILGILKVGAAYVPMEPGFPQARKQSIAESAGLYYVLCDTDNLEVQAYTCINLSVADLSHCGEDNLVIENDSRNLAYIIYTSGSTGKPKGVRIEHHSAVNLVAWVNCEFNVSNNDSIIFVTSVCFDLSVYDIFGLLGAGGRIVVATQDEVRDPQRLFKLMDDEKVTFWDSVPTTINHLVNGLEDGQQLNSLRLIFMSGDWIPVQLPSVLKTRFPKVEVISLGGATEGTVWSNYYPIDTEANYTGSIPYGKPIDNNRFYVLDKDQKPVVPGVAGELYIAGVGVADGYQSDETKTKASFFEDPFIKSEIHGLPPRMYKTGDLGRVMPCGNMEILGRIDHQVKIRGFRVELGEIESQITQHNDVKEAVVQLISANQESSTPNKDAFLAAYLVKQEGSSLDEEQLIDYLRQYLTDYMVPKVYVWMDALPINTSGKIDRKLLPKPELNAQQSEAYSAPRTLMEEKINAAWCDLFNLERISTTENFYTLGGDSLKVFTLVNLLKKHGIKLTAAQALRNQTVREMALVASLHDEESASKSISGIVPLTVSQQIFLDHYTVEPHWATVYIKFESVLNINSEILIESLKVVARSHDSLRARFIKNGEQWQQHILPADAFSVAYEYSDLQGLSKEEQIKIIHDKHKASVKDLDLEHGPLIKIDRFDLDANSKPLVKVLFHHLLMDGYSSMVVMDDWYRVYQSMMRDASPVIIEQSSNLLDLFEEDEHWFNSEGCKNELSYWCKFDWSNVLRQNAHDQALNEVGSQKYYRSVLDKVSTSAFIQSATEEIGISVPEYLIAGLTRTLLEGSGKQYLQVKLIDTARQSYEQLDLSRTVGWLSLNRTFLLSYNNAIAQSDAFKAVVSEIAQTPNGGQGFERIQSSHPNIKIRREFSERAQPEILVNYLGAYDDENRDSMERDEYSADMTWVHPKNKRNEKIACFAAIINGKLNLEWQYSSNLQSEAEIAEIARRFTDNLVLKLESKTHTEAGIDA